MIDLIDKLEDAAWNNDVCDAYDFKNELIQQLDYVRRQITLALESDDSTHADDILADMLEKCKLPHVTSP